MEGEPQERQRGGEQETDGREELKHVREQTAEILTSCGWCSGSSNYALKESDMSLLYIVSESH